MINEAAGFNRVSRVFIRAEGLLIFLFFLFSFLFVTCVNPLKNADEIILTASVGNSGSGRAICFPGDLYTETDLDFTFTFTNTSTNKTVPAIVSINSGTISASALISPGTWRIEIAARFSAASTETTGKLYAMGRVTRNIQKSENISVPMKSDGDGSAGNPFWVYDVLTLQKVGTGTDGWDLDKHYLQTDDIDLSSVPNWTPIGTLTMADAMAGIFDNTFTGSYNGNEHTITDLNAVSVLPPSPEPAFENMYWAMFGFIGPGSSIKNVTLVNCNISGYMASGIAGANLGTVDNCSVSGVVYGDHSAGGIVVQNNGDVLNCVATCAVTGNNSVGGISGDNYGTIQACYATGRIIGDPLTGAVLDAFLIPGGAIGGVVGWNIGMVTNCYATGEVSGMDMIGGVAGNVQDTLQNCYATGYVHGRDVVGGVAGVSTGIVRNCYSTGDVFGDNTIGGGPTFGGGYSIAGVVGDCQDGAITEYCYSTGEISGTFTIGGVVGFTHALSPGNTIVRNCVALNENIIETNVTFGGFARVYPNHDFNVVYNNNYGLDTMTINAVSYTPNKGITNPDGADVTAAQAKTGTWWTTAGNWSGGAWSTAVWETANGTRLPILKNMPAGIQNPQ